MSSNVAASPHQADSVVADQDDEQFDVVDEQNQPIGVATRKECHQRSLLHRSTHVLLFQKSESQPGHTEVLLQRRSKHKKVGAGLWDVSVAEHLSSGEDFATATLRGLAEELSLTYTQSDLVLIRPPYLSRQSYTEVGVTDHMFTTLFAARYNKEIHGDAVIDSNEVGDIKWWPTEAVVREAASGESVFTRWFMIELEHVNLQHLGARICNDSF